MSRHTLWRYTQAGIALAAFAIGITLAIAWDQNRRPWQ